MAIVNPESKSVEKIVGLGEKSWSGAKLDASNKDKIIGNLKSYPQLVGLFMPDTIDSYSVNGSTYIVSANEGDGREYGFKTTQELCDKAGFMWDEDDYLGTDEYTSEQGTCLSHIDEVRGKKLKVAAEHPLAEEGWVTGPVLVLKLRVPPPVRLNNFKPTPDSCIALAK